MYPEYMAESLRKVVQTRPRRLELGKKIRTSFSIDERCRA